MKAPQEPQEWLVCADCSFRAILIKLGYECTLLSIS
jgi:hypothetical protein